jgi:FSR family fosmidomycin resistance protein-like MFS transporter
VITVSSAHAVHDTYSAFLAPLLPLLIANLSLTKTAAGLLMVFYQGPSLLQPLIGHLADRHNLRPLVIMAPTVAAALFTLLGLTPSYGLLVLLLVVAGFNSSGLHAFGPVLAGVLSGQRLGRGMSFWMVGGELGRTLGPIISVAAVTYLTPSGLPALIPGGMVASFMVYLGLRRVPDHRLQNVNRPDWKTGLNMLRPILVPLTAVISARAMLVMALSTFLPTFLTENGSSLWLAGASLSVMEAAGVVGALFGGSLSDRLGRRRVLVSMSLAAPLAALAFLNVSGWAQFPLLLLVGLTLLSTTPVLMALVQERAPGSRALSNGIFMALNFVITSLAVVTVGIIGDHFSLQMAFTVSTLIMLAGLPFVFLLTPKKAETI